MSQEQNPFDEADIIHLLRVIAAAAAELAEMGCFQHGVWAQQVSEFAHKQRRKLLRLDSLPDTVVVAARNVEVEGVNLNLGDIDCHDYLSEPDPMPPNQV